MSNILQSDQAKPQQPPSQSENKCQELQNLPLPRSEISNAAFPPVYTYTFTFDSFSLLPTTPLTLPLAPLTPSLPFYLLFPMPFTFTLPPSIRLAIFTAKLVATAHLFNQWIGHPSLTDGPSMLPTLNVRDDYVWINCLYRRGKGIKLGDVVSLRHPLVPGDRACKRVVAMEGDFVGTGSPASGDRLMIQVTFFRSC